MRSWVAGYKSTETSHHKRSPILVGRDKFPEDDVSTVSDAYRRSAHPWFAGNPGASRTDARSAAASRATRAWKVSRSLMAMSVCGGIPYVLPDGTTGVLTAAHAVAGNRPTTAWSLINAGGDTGQGYAVAIPTQSDTAFLKGSTQGASAPLVSIGRRNGDPVGAAASAVYTVSPS